MNTKVDTRTEKVKIFIIAVEHNIGIQIERKELIKHLWWFQNEKNGIHGIYTAL